jgi:hypothetical protein
VSEAVRLGCAQDEKVEVHARVAAVFEGDGVAALGEAIVAEVFVGKCGRAAVASSGVDVAADFVHGYPRFVPKVLFLNQTSLVVHTGSDARKWGSTFSRKSEDGHAAIARYT